MNTIPPSLRGELIFAVNEPTKAMPDFHPTKPWILTAVDDNSTVVIWDYESKVKVVEFSVNQLDEERKESLALQKMLEKDPSYRGPRTIDPGAKVEKTGQVKYLRFFDRDTRLWKSILSKSISKEKDKGKKDAGNAPPLQADGVVPSLSRESLDEFADHNFVIIVAEYRIIFLDYVTLKIQEIKLSSLENKPQMCVDCIGRGASVVFGGSDGVLRMWDCDKWEMTKQFSGGHTKSIVKVMGYEMDGAEYLLSAGTDGVVCQWNVKKEHLIIQSFGKIHHDAILDFSYAHTGHLLSIGADKCIIMSEVSNGKEVCRANLKHTAGSVTHFPHPHTIGQSRPILVHYKDRGSLVVMDCAQASGIEVADLNILFNHPSKKDNCKIYNLVVHPLLPYLVLCCTNRGAAIVRIGWHPSPSIAVPTPISSATEESLGYYVTRQSTIHSVNLLPRPGKTALTPAKLSQTTGGVVEIAASGGGKHICVLWADLKRFQIFELPTWKSVEEGQAWGFCWAATGEDYAVLDMVPDEKEEEKRKRPKKDKDKKAEQFGGPMLRAVVHVTSVGSNDRREVTGCGSAVAITGGLLLGVHTQTTPSPTYAPAYPSTATASPALSSNHLSPPTASSDSPATSTTATSPTVPASPSLTPASAPVPAPVPTAVQPTPTASVLQFYDWGALRPTGPPLPAPRLIVSFHLPIQDKSQQQFALAYDTYFVILALSPSIRVVCRISHVMTSGTWHNSTLFYTTPTEVRAIFPHEQEVFPLILASFNFEPPMIALNEKDHCPDAYYRPAGFVSVVGVLDIPPYLLLLDSTTYKCFSIPLDFALLQFLVAVQANKIEAALKRIHRIEPSYHKQLARFLAVRGFAHEAAQLEGLSDSSQFSIASRYNLRTTNDTCFRGARGAFTEPDEKEEDVEDVSKEGEDGEDGAEEGVLMGRFADFAAADACLALGRLASDSNLANIAFKKAAEIASLACSSLEQSVPEYQKQEIHYLKQLWQQKLNLIDAQLKV